MSISLKKTELVATKTCHNIFTTQAWSGHGHSSVSTRLSLPVELKELRVLNMLCFLVSLFTRSDFRACAQLQLSEGGKAHCFLRAQLIQLDGEVLFCCTRVQREGTVFGKDTISYNTRILVHSLSFGICFIHHVLCILWAVGPAVIIPSG